MNTPVQNKESVKTEIIIGRLLKYGVLSSSVIVLFGGIVFLLRHGTAYPDYGLFHGQPIGYRTISGIARETIAFSSRGIMQLGILMLLATPVMRVLFSVVIFLREKDKLYVLVTTIVFAVLIYSIFFGG